MQNLINSIENVTVLNTFITREQSFTLRKNLVDSNFVSVNAWSQAVLNR